MHVEISEVSDPSAARGDRGAARRGARRMCAPRSRIGARCAHALAERELRSRRRRRSAEEELAETLDFLAWLGDDNFTFLGYREYRFGGGSGERRHRARRGLGVLRDPSYMVFDGLRNFAALAARGAAPSCVPPRVADHHQVEPPRDRPSPRAHGRDRREAVRPRRHSRRASGSSSASSPRWPMPRARAPSRCCAARSPRAASARGFDPRAMTARRCRTSSRPSRATSCSRSPRTSSTTSRSASSVCRSASASRSSRAAIPSGASSRASSMCRASATTPSCASASPRSSRRPSARRVDSFTTQLDEAVLARVHFILRTTAGRRRGRSRGGRARAGRGGAELGRPAATRRSSQALGEERASRATARYGTAFPSGLSRALSGRRGGRRHRAHRGGARAARRSP